MLGRRLVAMINFYSEADFEMLTREDWLEETKKEKSNK